MVWTSTNGVTSAKRMAFHWRSFRIVLSSTLRSDVSTSSIRASCNLDVPRDEAVRISGDLVDTTLIVLARWPIEEDWISTISMLEVQLVLLKCCSNGFIPACPMVSEDVRRLVWRFFSTFE